MTTKTATSNTILAQMNLTPSTAMKGFRLVDMSILANAIGRLCLCSQCKSGRTGNPHVGSFACLCSFKFQADWPDALHRQLRVALHVPICMMSLAPPGICTL